MKIDDAYEKARQFIGDKYHIAKGFKYRDKFVFVLDIPNNYSGTYVAVDFNGKPHKYVPTITKEFISLLRNPTIDYRRNQNE